MVKLFLQGELLYMTILTVLLVNILCFSLISFQNRSVQLRLVGMNDWRLKGIQSVGLFAFVFGLLTQLLGLIGALEAIEIWGKVESEMLFIGIRTSFIPMIYGLIIFLISRIITYGVSRKLRLQA